MNLLTLWEYTPLRSDNIVSWTNVAVSMENSTLKSNLISSTGLLEKPGWSHVEVPFRILFQLFYFDLH